MFETPILLLIFNRPKTTRRVFEQIKQVKPKYFFIAADGPRYGNPEDISKCAEARAISREIDWDCELKTLFRIENRGCGYGPAEAITWFFEQVEQGIVLEDDCLPSQGFFPFCEELLERFKDDEKIGIISGFNKMSGWEKKKSYTYSYLGDTWGWAGWRRSWQYFDYDMTSWELDTVKAKVRNTLQNNKLFEIYSKEFNYCRYENTQNHIWDCQWLFARLSNNMCSIVPAVNLINNIGYGEDATHTFTANQAKTYILSEEISFPLKHHPYKINRFFDKIVFERFLNLQKISLFKKIYLKLIKMITNTNR